MWEWLPDDADGECCVSKTAHKQDRLHIEGSCMKTEPKVLDLKSRKENLSPERIKVRVQ